MIISHEHRFIFLKTKKTAGTSIELALSRICGPHDIITPLNRYDEAMRDGRGPQNWQQHSWFASRRPIHKRRLLRFTARDRGFYNHIPAGEARQLLGDDEIWNSYFKFAFDRNPWDRQVSIYHHRFRRAKLPPPFPKFMAGGKGARVNNFEIYSLDGDICVDFLGRYENLSADLQVVLERIGIKANLQLPRAKGEARKSKIPYQDYYDERSKNIVADWYRREIGHFGYEF